MICSSLVPLECLERGAWAEVADVDGDRRVVARMADFGLRPGVHVRMLQPGSPCLFELGPSRVSLRLDQAVQVLVRPMYLEGAALAGAAV